MLRGFYTAASGMIAQQRRQEALSNNMANANTPGYRADETPLRAFPEMLMQRMGTKRLPVKNYVNLPANRLLGSMNTGVYVHETIPDFRQGDLHETNMSTDLAIQELNIPDQTGSLFFTVQNENGEERFTRNGQFTVDGDGYLTTANGYYVLADNGSPIHTNGTDFRVTNEGTIQLANGDQVDLAITYVPDARTLRKEGNDLFEGEGEFNPNVTYNIHQGHIERSNVDTGQTMAEMMNAYRIFEANQRVLKAYDESMEKAVSEVGRLV